MTLQTLCEQCHLFDNQNILADSHIEHEGMEPIKYFDGRLQVKSQQFSREMTLTIAEEIKAEICLHCVICQNT